MPASAPPKAHRDELESLLAALRSAVQLEMRRDQADPVLGGEAARHALLAHFPELAEPVAEWDGTIERLSSAPAALWQWLSDAILERGMTEPPVAIGSLVDRLAFITLERARRGLLRAPHPLYLKQLPSRIMREEVVVLYLDGQRVAALAARLPETERELDALGLSMQEVFDEAQRCDQAVELDAARDALLLLKQRLLAIIDGCAASDRVGFSPACPACRLSASARTGRPVQ
jgi:hypothetical protein